MAFRWFLVGGLLLGIACAPSPGDCPTPDDCACPCSDEQALTCDTTGRVYLNQCMLECDGKTVGSCEENPDGSPQGAGSPVDCDAQCSDAGTTPVCGAVGQGGDRVHRWFDNACYRDCLDAQNAPDRKCE